jgi:hypothetical protein
MAGAAAIVPAGDGRARPLRQGRRRSGAPSALPSVAF